MAEMDWIEGAAQNPESPPAAAPFGDGGMDAQNQPRSWPRPKTTNFSVVRPSTPTGPRAWSLSVLMPISAPRPYSKPSAQQVGVLTMTELESTSRRKRCARSRVLGDDAVGVAGTVAGDVLHRLIQAVDNGD